VHRPLTEPEESEDSDKLDEPDELEFPVALDAVELSPAGKLTCKK
jgi:hypothetical protein